MRRSSVWCGGFLLAVSLLLPALPAVGEDAPRPQAVIDKITGGGGVEASTGPEALLKLDALGLTDVDALAENDALPARFWTLRKNLLDSGTDIGGWTAVLVRVNVDTSAAMLDLAETAMKPLLDAAAAPDAPEEVRALVEENMKKIEEGRKVLEQMRALLEFMESRDYLTWKPVADGDVLAEGQTLRTGAGTEATLQCDRIGFVRLRESSSLVIRKPRIQRTPVKTVMIRLWRGIANFYFPKGAEGAKHFEISTDRVSTSIQGTEFKMTHEDGRTTIDVSEGVVEATDSDGEVFLLSAGESRTFGAPDEAAEPEPEPAAAEVTPPAEDDPEWKRRKVYNVTLLVPVVWDLREDSQDGMTEWGVFLSDGEPIVLLSVFRVFSPEPLIERYEISSKTPIEIGGRAATFCQGRPSEEKPEGRVLLVVLDEQEMDGGHIAVVGRTKDDSAALDLTLRRAIASVRIDDRGGVKGLPAPAADAPRDPEPPAPDAEPAPDADPAPKAVWVRRTVGNVTVEVPDSWTEAKDAPEGSGMWYLGEDASEPKAAFGVLRLDSFEEFLKGLVVDEQSAIEVDGRPATRRRGQPKGEDGRAVLILLDQPEPDGNTVGFIAYSSGDHWTAHDETYRRIFASVKIGK